MKHSNRTRLAIIGLSVLLCSTIFLYADLDYLRKSGGWEIGTGPSVVIVDEGMARSFTTTTLRKGVYAFAFGQRGLMAGLGLQGTKITPIHTD